MKRSVVRFLKNSPASQKSYFCSIPLQCKVDIYNGINITEDIKSCSPETFEQRLQGSMNLWKGDNRKGVWLRIPIECSELVPAATRHGFWFHHCNPEYVMMCTWLQGGRKESRLPAAPSHYIGVAGFVMNSREELLVIQEKHGPASKFDLWKLPGGLLDLGEDIAKGVTREVREETGVDCKFHSMVAIVEGHEGRGPARQSASDLYCISILTCDDEQQALIPQDHEIAKCEWRPVESVLENPFYSESTAFGKCFHTARSSYKSIASTQPKGESTSVSLIGLKNATFPIGRGDRSASVYFI